MEPNLPAGRGGGAVRFWRRRADKRNAVAEALAATELDPRSDREVARHLDVSHQLVAAVRRERGDPVGSGTRQAHRGASSYSMNTGAINAARAAARARAALESPDDKAVLRRRQLATAAYDAMRARIAESGPITEAGLRVLERVEWRAWGEVQRFEAAVRAAGQRFISGEPGAGQRFQAALASWQWAWTHVLSVLRQHQGR